MLLRSLPAAIAITALGASALAQTGNLVNIPPHNNVYNGFSRGYSFTATTDFLISDLNLPTDAQQAGDTAGVRVVVNGVEVFYSAGSATALLTPAPPILVFNGDVVEVVGNWSPAVTGNFSAHNSYGLTGPYNTAIEGLGTQLFRAGVQWDIGDPGYAAAASFNGLNGSLGRIEMYTGTQAGLYASFTATPSAGASPLSVQFADTSFTDDPAGVQTWDWDLDGDGVTDSTVASPTFTYASCGSYDVTLTVTDLINGTSAITVNGAVNVDEVSASFDVQELVPGAGIWQFTDTSTPTPTAWAWDFDGDGTIDDTTQNPVYAQPVPTALLSLPTCTLTVTGAGGCFTDTLVRDVQQPGYGVAQGPVGGGNGTVATPNVGCYFDISLPVSGLNITGMDTAIYNFGGAMDVSVYVRPGTAAGFEGIANEWTLVATGTGNPAGGAGTSPPELASITLNSSFYLPQGDYGVAVFHTDPAGGAMNIAYTNGPANSPYGDANLVIHPNGAGCSSAVGTLLGGCSFSPRLWNGRFYYEDCALANNAAAGSFANGCANSSGVVPSLSVASLPQIGGTYTLDVDPGLAGPQAVVMVLGVSKDIYNGLPLPLDLAILGAPGCMLATDVLATDLLLTAGGVTPWSFAVANDPTLMCFEFYQQGAVLDPAANSFGFVVSNATAAVCGN